MKKIIFLALMFVGTISMAQTKLSLKINHKLGSNTFTYNDTCYNNLGNKINVTRLEYYLTVVSVTHDGGIVTPINKILLVNAGTTLLDSLATFSITTLEKVTIAVGVDSSLNHLDPSQYAATHPLAPKSPSMHWGWTPGYRFVAMEGKTFASSPTRLYNLHSLGDDSYFHATINTAGVSTTGEITIELNADYLESLKDIDLSYGPLEHGDSRINKKHLGNFRDYVFTSIEGNTSMSIKEDKNEKISVLISPNPAAKGENIILELNKELKDASLLVFDMQGKIVFKQKVSAKKTKINELDKGVYICTLKQGNKVVTSQKIIITN